MDILNFTKRFDVEAAEHWMEWGSKIPAIKFPAEWAIQVIPPFVGAMVRFIVHFEGTAVSVYLDCYDRLGCFGAPYWEIYCREGSIKESRGPWRYPMDDRRYPMDDIEGLLKGIKEMLE